MYRFSLLTILVALTFVPRAPKQADQPARTAIESRFSLFDATTLRSVGSESCGSCHQVDSETQGYWVHSFGSAQFASISYFADWSNMNYASGAFPLDSVKTPSATTLGTHQLAEVSSSTQEANSTDEGGSFNCQSWNSCHTDVQPGFCGQWHDACGGSSLALSVAAAAQSHSMSVLMDVAARYPAFVRVVGKCGVVQVLNCEGHIVAQHRFADQMSMPSLD